MGALVKLLGGVRATVFALAVLALVAALWVQGKRIDGFKRDAATKESTIFDLTVAARMNQRTLEKMKVANEAWAERARVDTIAMQEATDKLHKAEQARSRALSAASDRRSAIYRGNTNADQWAADAMPGAVFVELRNGSARHHD